MTSAVLDVTLCLLLVSAAGVTLVTVPSHGQAGIARDDGRVGDTDVVARDRSDADAVATTLTTSTASVNYTLASGAKRADETLVSFPVTDGPEFDRTGHGTLATLLADVTVNTVTLDGEQLTHTGDGFREAVRRQVERDIAHDGVQVVVRWRPYRGSHVRGNVSAGPTPPPQATVHAAAVSAPSGLPSTETDARIAARESGYEGVARVVARTLIAGLFPPDEFRFALRGDYPVSRLARYRYRRMGETYGVTVVGDDGHVDPAKANDRLAAALATVIERDLRRTYDSPETAAADIRADEVRIVVRTWSG